MLDAGPRAGRAQLGHRGALFPWRTINGEEASAYYAAGTAQYHINADIAYALRQYAGSPATTTFVRERGRRDARRDGAAVVRPRLLLRAPRRPVLHQRRHRARRVHDGRRQQHLHEPDGAREPRGRRARAWSGCSASDPERPRAPRPRDRARPTTRSTEWRRAAEHMYVPLRRASSAMLLQDEHFLDREPWDFEAHAAPSTTRCCCTTTR